MFPCVVRIETLRLHSLSNLLMTISLSDSSAASSSEELGGGKFKKKILRSLISRKSSAMFTLVIHFSGQGERHLLIDFLLRWSDRLRPITWSNCIEPSSCDVPVMYQWCTSSRTNSQSFFRTTQHVDTSGSMQDTWRTWAIFWLQIECEPFSSQNARGSSTVDRGLFGDAC